MSVEIEKLYQKLKHEEHILTIPDTYIGSVEKNEGLTEQQIREGLEGNICRCTGYHNIVKSVQAAAQEMGG